MQDQARVLWRVVLTAVVDAVQTGGERVSAVLRCSAEAERQAGEGAVPALDPASDPVNVNCHSCARAFGASACVVE